MSVPQQRGGIQRSARLFLPFRLLWWAVTFQLGRRLQLRRDYRLIARSGIFDAAFYLRQNDDAAQAGVDPLLDYLTRGGFEGPDPHPLFDTDWYLQQNPDVAAAGINPLLHYLRQGWMRGRSPHPLFDTTFYLERNPDIARGCIEPVHHYVTHGAWEGRDPHPLFDNNWYFRLYADEISAGETPLSHYVLRGAAELRRPHPLFEPEFYLINHPDAAIAGMNPLVHYLTRGAQRGYSPHPLFDVEFYLLQTPGLTANGADPLRHYICEGAKNGLDPCDLFDSSFYLEQYPAVAQAGFNPLAHYWTEGIADDCNPNPLFDTSFYLTQYPGIAAARVNPLVDFITYGAVEGRFPNPFFDPLFYFRKNPDVKRAGMNPLAHYLRRGAEEGRDPSQFFSTVGYLSEHPELKNSGINPLAHFLGYSNQSLTSDDDRGTLDAATVLLPARMPDDAILSQANWRFVPASRPIAAFNQALRNASDAGQHLLVLLGPVLPGTEAVGRLIEAFNIDPHFGVATPRQSDPVTGEILKLSGDLGDPELSTLPASVLAAIPEHYILPDILSSCFILRNSVISNFDLLDETHETLAGALQHYLCKIRRCGFRCVVVNDAVVPRRPGTGSWTVPVTGTDLRRLHTEHPDIGQAKTEFLDHPLHLHESLLGRALSRNPSVRQTLLLDIRGIPSHIDGTAEAVLGLCDGLLSLNHDWAITLLAASGPAEFHKLAERYPKWEIIGEESRRYFTAALRPSQPWNIKGMIDLHRMALFNFYTMLDTIAWDILFVAPRGLTETWDFLSTYADGIVYISQYTRDRFATRFPSTRRTPAYVSYLSLNPDDYKVESLTSDEHFILVVGNTYDHKNVYPTVDLLMSAFPSCHIKAFGIKSHPSSLVDCLESGRLHQIDVDRLFAQAAVIVFPSFYEGFGFPVLKGLSNNRTVIARHSELLLEIASHYRGPGRLASFHTRTELVDLIERAVHHEELTEIPLGTSLGGADEPTGWKEIAAGVLRFIEAQVQGLDRCRWRARESAIEQLNAYSG